MYSKWNDLVGKRLFTYQELRVVWEVPRLTRVPLREGALFSPRLARSRPKVSSQPRHVARGADHQWWTPPSSRQRRSPP